MPQLAWTDDLLTGNSVIDEQHQQLFKMVGELDDAMVKGRAREVIVPTLERLANYTIEHFRGEERLMSTYGYPDYQAHKQLHVELTQKVQELLGALQEGRPVSAIKVSDFLNGWLRGHINGIDKKMVAFLATRQERSRL